MGMITVNDETIMEWGAHKGEAMANIPAKDLIWYKKQWDEGLWKKPFFGFNKALYEYIKDNMDAFELEIKRNGR